MWHYICQARGQVSLQLLIEPCWGCLSVSLSSVLGVGGWYARLGELEEMCEKESQHPVGVGRETRTDVGQLSMARLTTSVEEMKEAG